MIKGSCDFGENKINFQFLVERLFIPDLNEKLDAVVALYLKKVYQLLETESGQICYQMVSFEYLDQYDEKLYSNDLIAIKFNLEFSLNRDSELKPPAQENSYDTKTTFIANLKDIGYKQLLELCKLKVSRF